MIYKKYDDGSCKVCNLNYDFVYLFLLAVWDFFSLIILILIFY